MLSSKGVEHGSSRSLICAPDGKAKPDDKMEFASFDRDLHFVAVSNNKGGITVCDVTPVDTKSNEPWDIHVDDLAGITMSEDGTSLAAFTRHGHLKVYYESGTKDKDLKADPDEQEILNAEFSPDGNYVVTTGFGITANVVDLHRTPAVRVLEGHGARINLAKFSRDGLRIITASDDRTAKVWDFRTGKELLTLGDHDDKVSWADITNDGKRIATASDDGTARVYLIDPDELMKVAPTRVTRDLTPQECRRYLDKEQC
jgi:WD40 repeat protein